eukprot:GABV01008804.1.p1 GENE.GABV01008804.1~~GABV01008804.1.p1  ORF type:complete len:214 (-),score=72.64 GABV01008804.1:363-1004(-)
MQTTFKPAAAAAALLPLFRPPPQPLLPFVSRRFRTTHLRLKDRLRRDKRKMKFIPFHLRPKFTGLRNARARDNFWASTRQNTAADLGIDGLEGMKRFVLPEMVQANAAVVLGAGDLLELKEVQCIVNPANKYLEKEPEGLNADVHKRAGPGLDSFLHTKRTTTGMAVVTPSFTLGMRNGPEWIIHAVPPDTRAGEAEEAVFMLFGMRCSWLMK